MASDKHKPILGPKPAQDPRVDGATGGGIWAGMPGIFGRDKA